MNKKYYGNYDLESGDYLGLYPTDMYRDIDSIPEPKIELSRQQWEEVMSATKYKVINGVHTLSNITKDELDKNAYESIKRRRLNLLKESDWVVLPHSPVTGAKLDEWIVYRQALRDVTEQEPPYSLPDKPNNL
jgi:hypothetical protein